MNEHLDERFSKRSKKQPPTAGGDTMSERVVPHKLNPRVARYFEKSIDGPGWLSSPELPTSAEVMDHDDDNSSSSDVVELEPNRPFGAWQSKEEYLSTQYDLYREDAVRGLREAVTRMRICPDAVEDSYNGKIGIYEKVHICGVTASTRGLAHRITFSTRRAGKIILWEQSKRLIAGGLVVLTPADDKFKSKAIVATVAARPLEHLKFDPPELDLFFASADDLEIDPAIEWLMIEDKSGLYEANRHTLLALQRMMREPFPLSEHILSAQTTIAPPKYILEHPHLNLAAVLDGDKEESYENVDVVKSWPHDPQSQLDSSQLEALQRILAKRLAIVQGPPGTGKTHVSVKAVKVMLENWKPGDPPILVACQTNHAIDQFLRHVATFETEFVRLGGRSKDKDVVKKRVLFNVRKETSENPPAGSLYTKARASLYKLQKQLPLLLTALQPGKKPLDHRLLQSCKILTEAQADSLQEGASRWVQSTKTISNEAYSPFTVWLGSKLIPVNPKQTSNEHGFDHEEADLEQERLREEEAENAAQEEEEFDKLYGQYYDIADNFTCRRAPGIDHKAEEFLKQQDMWKIPEAARGAVYRHLQSALKKYILPGIRDLAKKLSEEAGKRRIGQFEMDELILKRQKIIGMTTTGLGKYRGLLSALQPRVVLIEEAAETLEAPVTVACMPSLQHLILVGDHLQLRPHTHVNEHEDEPWYLNVSLFERMVNNKLEYSTLRKQRRMIPEVRRILAPIYGDLIEDHPSVSDPKHRPSVPGMGGVNSFWFTHAWRESRDDMMSCYNEDEARMIAGFVEYLCYNDVQPEDITILTFYNGQRKKILAELRARVALRDYRFAVVTVDSYQGEENKIVLLSLARSNENYQIGFLSVDNRVCVALSRAQCGFYIFGNARLPHNVERSYAKVKPKKRTERQDEGKLRKPKTWTQVMQIMAGQEVARPEEIPRVHPQRFDEKFPIHCRKHNTKVVINSPEDWESINGGCTINCQEQLPCGHPCPCKCHPFDHNIVNCTKCREQPTTAAGPQLTAVVKKMSAGQLSDGSRATSSSGDSESWKTFAVAAQNEFQQAIDAYVPYSQLPKPKATLIEIDDAGTARDLATVQTNVENLSIESGSASTATHSHVSQSTKKPKLGLDGAADDSSSSGSIPAGKAKRQKWKETFRPEKEPAKKDWSQEESLLD
ncbi:hypothetical protein CBER1_02950 [Cercospora berteroae]|uniref:Helicase ATP-binding domain-containing protein n=1 Tax=Cercospora berteroae TaxID=357750 RepID=A0A2S6C2U8_9PEZI|nr:hypothetical protein CBER1_02950 [Cercospora berteroae]